MCFFFVFFFLMIRRPPISTQSRSSAASDVYKRQVGNIGFIGNPALKTLASDLIDGIVFTAPRFALDLSLIHISEPTRPY